MAKNKTTEERTNRTLRHIAIILDGNRRWSRERSLPVFKGHAEGAKTLEKVLGWCKKYSVKILTVYVLSSENLKNRSKEELKFLFSLFKQYLKRSLKSKELEKEGVRFNALGRIEKLPKDLQNLLKEAMNKTKDYTNYVFNVCLVYDGQDEIVDAVKDIIEEGVNADDVNRDAIKSHLYTHDIPAPELIIRTGMNPEKRLSGFLLWDSSYSEFYFTKTYWPAFSEKELVKALNDYRKRHRRFGR